jgi:hypothetical protein
MHTAPSEPWGSKALLDLALGLARFGRQGLGLKTVMPGKIDESGILHALVEGNGHTYSRAAKRGARGLAVCRSGQGWAPVGPPRGTGVESDLITSPNCHGLEDCGRWSAQHLTIDEPRRMSASLNDHD